MSITNNDGFTFINAITRKERQGSPLTPDRYNNYLNICFEERLSDAFSQFEKDQRSTDFFREVKSSDVINPDSKGNVLISSLTDTYWHPSKASYDNSGVNTSIDIVSDEEWGDRLSSSLELPTTDFPICNIYDENVRFYPISRPYDSDNTLINAGSPGGTDWIDTDTDGIADNWTVLAGTEAYFSILTNEYDLDGRSQACDFGGVDCDMTNASIIQLRRNSWYYIELEYWLDSGSSPVQVFGVKAGATGLIDITPEFDKKVKYSGYFYNDSPTYEIDFGFLAGLSGIEAGRIIVISRIFCSEMSSPYDVTFNYLKQPATPYFDWYYDANDRIQYLEAYVATEYTLKTGETYIDKVTGVADTTVGHTIGSISGGDDHDNKTVEMEIPDDEKRAVFYSILSKNGISLEQMNTTQYSMQMESKEIMK